MNIWQSAFAWLSAKFTRSENDSDDPRDVVTHPAAYRNAVVASFVPAILALITMIFGGGVYLFGLTIPFWGVFLTLQIVYSLASIFFVQTEELAGITVLEIPAKEAQAGMVYAPLFITELERFPRSIQQDQFPGEPEQISKLPDAIAQELKDGLLRPIRIATGPAKADSDDILNARLTLEPSFTIQWQVEFDKFKHDDDNGFFEFYVNIPGKHWADKYFFLTKMLRDTGERILNIELAKRSAAEVINDKAELIEAMQNQLMDATAKWGIAICEVNVLGLEPDHATNKALGLIPQAKAAKLADITTAEGQRQAAILRSEGEAQAIVNIGKAKGEARKAEALASEVTSQELMAFEVAKAITPGSTVILGADGIAEAVTKYGKSGLGLKGAS